MWTRHEGFQSFVHSYWHGYISDSPMENLSYKLRNLKLHLKWWNWHVYRNIHTQVEDFKKELAEVERELQRPSPIGHLKLNVDGAARENPRPVGGGGILRDHIGSIIFAFSHYYDVQTNTAVEAMAIHNDFLLCEECTTH
ncbi:unnamed protein product [Spirodela intermedia]|uniref:RNase H type-1 domain-containing protein n=1 Tax=Spirodela intermedia TaxID=51605 RepID=A0ABN7E8Y5_SPIIN|nr:unnamed protein product [Spirodela intermedia]